MQGDKDGKGRDKGGSELAWTAKKREGGMKAAGCMQAGASPVPEYSSSSYLLIKLYSKLSFFMSVLSALCVHMRDTSKCQAWLFSKEIKTGKIIDLQLDMGVNTGQRRANRETSLCEFEPV